MSYKGLVFAAITLAASAAPAAAHRDYYYSGYNHASRSWNSGYSSVRPSFWGWPTLYLPGQPKVIATADEVERAQAYEDWYGYRPDSDPYYGGLGLAGLPDALNGAAADAFEDAAQSAGYSGQPDDGPDYDYDRPGYRPTSYAYSDSGADDDGERHYGPVYYDEPRHGYGWRKHRGWSHGSGWNHYRKMDHRDERQGPDFGSGWGG